MAIWLTGLSSAGKTTIAQGLLRELVARGQQAQILDGDEIRKHRNSDLGFSKTDRDENIRRIGLMAEEVAGSGSIAIVAVISPYREARNRVRTHIRNFIEVYVNAPLAVVEQRDLKGIYRRARAGEIQGVTGMDDPYEPPLNPEVECRTDLETPEESVQKVLRAVELRASAHV